MLHRPRDTLYMDRRFRRCLLFLAFPMVTVNPKAYSRSRPFLSPDETLDMFAFVNNFSSVAFDQLLTDFSILLSCVKKHRYKGSRSNIRRKIYGK